MVQIGEREIQQILRVINHAKTLYGEDVALVMRVEHSDTPKDTSFRDNSFQLNVTGSFLFQLYTEVVQLFPDAITGNCRIEKKDTLCTFVFLEKNTMPQEGYIHARGEAVQYIAQLLTNGNSFDRLNFALSNKTPQFDSLITEFRKSLQEQTISMEDIIIESSGSMAAYGLRDVNDLDYFSRDSALKIGNSDSFENRHHYEQIYHADIPALLDDPQNYFLYRGLKFASLERIVNFKHELNRRKDHCDLQLIAYVHKKRNLMSKMIYTLVKDQVKLLSLSASIHRFLLRAVYKAKSVFGK